MKQLQKITALLTALLLMVFTTILVSAESDIDFDKYIAEYVPTWYNDLELEIGQTHRPTSSVWVHGSDDCGSSDPQVVTVDETGVVTAVGPGTAYVVYLGIGTMHSTYRYTVIGSSFSQPISPSEPVTETTEVSITEATTETITEATTAPSTEATEETEPDTIDFSWHISQFRPGADNDHTLTVGQRNYSSYHISNYTAYGSSDESVVTVSARGEVTAVGVGTAYVVLTQQQTTEVHRFTVKEAAETEPSTPPVISTPSDRTPIRTVKSAADDSHFLGDLFFFLFWALLIWTTVMILWLIYRVNRAEKNPNEDTAKALTNMLRFTGGFTKLMIRSNMFKFGLRYDRLRDLFNYRINPKTTIRSATKLSLKNQLIALKIYGLDSVNTRYNPPHKPTVKSNEPTHSYTNARPKMTEEEIDAAKREFGDGGEDHVWHCLQYLPGLGGYDVYRDVRLAGDDTRSQIDAIVVSEKLGIFLLEVKSLGGKPAPDGVKVVSFDQLKVDPSSQILQHQATFTNAFSDWELTGLLQNVLVFSYPHNRSPRRLDMASFTDPLYDVVAVDRLLAYFQNCTQGNPVAPALRREIAQKLSACAREYTVTCLPKA